MAWAQDEASGVDEPMEAPLPAPESPAPMDPDASFPMGPPDGASTGAASAAASTDEAVQAILSDAVAEYDAARYPEALALFRRAHELTPTARTLRGIGMAAFESGQYVTALRALRAALDEPARPLTDAQRDHVMRLIERTEVFVATLTLDLTPPDAAFLVDASPPEREEDGTLLLNAGHHTIAVTDRTGRTQTLELDLVGGTERTVVIRADAAVNGSQEAVLAGGLTLVVTGALAALAAGATGIVALVLHDQLAAACDGFVCPESQIETRGRAADLSLATDILGGVSAGVLATGIVMTLVAVSNSAPPPVSLACGPTGCGLTWTGVF